MVRFIVCGDYRAQKPEIIHLDKEVESLLTSADFNICNFEAPIVPEGAMPIKKSGPALSQSRESASFLKKNGFKVFLLANNHVMDYGEIGLNSTINSLQGSMVVGAGSSQDAYAARYFETGGMRLGFISLVHHEYGVVEGVDAKGVGAAWLCSPDVQSVISNARGKCDYLFVFPHAGVEHTVAPLYEWRRLYKKFIDWGADAVVACHPHCPQGWESYKEKPIYYSLGNFYFDGLSHDSLWYKSIAIEFCIDNNISSKEHFLCFDDKTGKISLDQSEDIKEYIEYANSLLKNEKEYNDYLDKTCSTLWPDIKYGLLRGLCGVSLKVRPKWIIRLLGGVVLGNSNELYLQNALQCESHRWVLERYLRNRINKSK